MKRLLLAAALLLILATTYLVLLPASWLDTALQRASQGSLAMTGTSGSLWRGEGKLQAILPSGEAVTLAPVRWQLPPAELLRLRLHLRMESLRDGSPVLDVQLRPGEATVREARLELPAALLGVLSPTLREAGFSGGIALQVKEVRFGSDGATGHATAFWRDAASSLTRIRPLGSYLVDVNGKGRGLDFTVNTMGGPLALRGTGSWSPGKPPDLAITATAEEGARQELNPLLRLIGRQVAPGTYQLSFGQTVGVASP